MDVCERLCARATGGSRRPLRRGWRLQRLSDAAIAEYNKSKYADGGSKYKDDRVEVQLAFDKAAYKSGLQQEAEDGWNSVLNPTHNVQDGTLPKGDYESEEAEDSQGSDTGSATHTSEDHDSNGQDGS